MVIEFAFGKTWNQAQDERFEEFLDTLPDPAEMPDADLADYLKQVEELIVQLDEAEPRNEQSENYELWADRHEELEDIQDELLDRLEAISGK